MGKTLSLRASHLSSVKASVVRQMLRPSLSVAAPILYQIRSDSYRTLIAGTTSECEAQRRPEHSERHNLIGK